MPVVGPAPPSSGSWILVQLPNKGCFGHSGDKQGRETSEVM